MKMKKLSLLLAAMAFTFVISLGQTVRAEHGGVMQTWYTLENKSKVQIYKCGEKICGKFIWLKEPTTEEGKPKIDINNEDEDARGKPIIGLVMLNDFVEDAQTAHAWTGGTIYDPENGKTYSSNMTLNDDGTLTVRGYVGLPIFGRSQEWLKAE
jgi:uncharacterized protein (DUF2147 family)